MKHFRAGIALLFYFYGVSAVMKVFLFGCFLSVIPGGSHYSIFRGQFWASTIISRSERSL
jgi:hypothetical protein